MIVKKYLNNNRYERINFERFSKIMNNLCMGSDKKRDAQIEERIFKILAALIRIDEHSSEKFIDNFEASSYLQYITSLKSIGPEETADYIEILIKKMEK